MDINQLKRVLNEQKIPMEKAVAEKLAYLQSDEVFTEKSSNWKNFGSSMGASDNMSFEAAFGLSTPSTTDQMAAAFSAPVQSPVRMGNPRQQMPMQPMQQAPSEPRRAMTMAERIAALRGAVSVTQGISSQHKN